MPMPPVVHWFVSREDYAEIRRICDDGDGMPAEYDVFAKNVQDFLDAIHKQGGNAVKVYIDPAAFLAWCHTQVTNVDSNARRIYATRVFAESDKN